MITHRFKLFKLLLSLLQVKKLKLSMNSKFIQNLCNDFLFSLLQRSVSRSDSWETLFNNTFLFTCYQQRVACAAVYFLSPEITVVCGLLVCVMHNRIMFSKLLLCTGWHVTFQAKIRLMTRKSTIVLV